MKTPRFYLIILLLPTVLLSEDIFVPFDDNGFYGGVILLVLLVYIGIFVAIFSAFLMLLPALLGIGFIGINYLLPLLIQEFKALLEYYYTLQLKKALYRHALHFIAFSIIFISLLLIIYHLFSPSYLYLIALIIFGYSSFMGWYVFLFFLLALHRKAWLRVLVALILGGGIFLVFAPSGYLVFEPLLHHDLDEILSLLLRHF